MWKLYDDQNPVRTYMSWKEIMENIIEQGTLPTVLVYEKMNNQNKENSAFDILSATEISQLEQKAQELQKIIDQYDLAEAKAKLQDEKKAEKQIEK